MFILDSSNDNKEQYYKLFNDVNKDINNIDKFII